MFLFRTNLEYVFLRMQILDTSLWLPRPWSAIPGLYNRSFCPRLPQVPPPYHEKYFRIVANLIPSAVATNPKLSASHCLNPHGRAPFLREPLSACDLVLGGCLFSVLTL